MVCMLVVPYVDWKTFMLLKTCRVMQDVWSPGGVRES